MHVEKERGRQAEDRQAEDRQAEDRQTDRQTDRDHQCYIDRSQSTCQVVDEK